MAGRTDSFSPLRAPLIRRAVQATIVAAGLLAGLVCASAETAPGGSNASRANKGTVGVISGGADGTYIRIAADLANVLDNDDLRILPVVGRGSLQNLKDIMFLRGVDIGIVQMDAREQLKAENLQNDATQRLRFITRLYNEEVHLIASRDITDIRQLDGKTVNIDKAGSGTNMTARLIFEKLGIKPELTTFDQASSYAKLKAGEIQAAVYVAGHPVRAIAEFQTDGRFHLLSIPFEGEIAESYFPARLDNADYPQLVDQDKPVETLAVGSLLAVYNWPTNSDRYNRVKRFVDAFFSRFEEFHQPGRHPKWQEVNLAAEVPGWQRIKAAQDWLDRATAAGNPSPEMQTFESFMQAKGITASPEQREALFRDFLAWRNDRSKAMRRVTRQE